MKPLIMFFLLFILHAIATEILFSSNKKEMRKFDRELEIKSRGAMYYFPVTRG